MRSSGLNQGSVLNVSGFVVWREGKEDPNAGLLDEWWTEGCLLMRMDEQNMNEHQTENTHDRNGNINNDTTREYTAERDWTDATQEEN